MRMCAYVLGAFVQNARAHTRPGRDIYKTLYARSFHT